MEHEDCQALLGAYALDAVDADEATQIAEHLAGCPRCQVEMAGLSEMATLLGNSGSDAPLAVWDRIANQIAAGPPAESWPVLAERLQIRPRSTRRRRLIIASAGSLLGVAALAIALLGIKVSNLDSKVGSDQALSRISGINAAVASVMKGAHRTTVLLSTNGAVSGTIAIAPDDEAYWVKSNLPRLPADQTYQLWTLSKGQPVSLGLLGPNPNEHSAFRLQPSMHSLMLTSEPEGGTVAPTTAVLLQGSVSI